jgi:hypothetical protein
MKNKRGIELNVIKFLEKPRRNEGMKILPHTGIYIKWKF